MKLRFREIPALPRLGWVAVVRTSEEFVDLVHGSRVECRDAWFVEGVWDADFEQGNFGANEHFFGSGARVDGSALLASASTSLTDRLLYCRLPDATLISNSLVLLLAAIDGRLGLEHDYFGACHASMSGIFHYPREFPVESPRVGAIHQLIHGNLRVGPDGISESVRTRRHRIDSFDDYISKLTDVIRGITSNAASPYRRFSLAGITTLSTGYDSPAVSALVREFGVDTCFTTAPANRKEAKVMENGVPLARSLGYEPLLLQLPSRDTDGDDELFFLAPTFDGSELVFHTLARYVSELRGGALLWTGYHGDKVWDFHTDSAYLADDILRGDTSGLNLSEIRLEAGFINVAVPFIHARSIGDLVEIARGEEMSPWRLGNDYDRPIPRRIVESAGGNRRLFGRRKRVVMRYRNFPHSASLREEFLRFLRESTPYGRVHVSKQEWLSKADYLLHRLGGTRLIGALERKSLKQRFVPRHADLQQLMFKWAVERLVVRYRPLLAHLLSERLA